MIQVTIEVLADRSAVMDTTNAIESLNRGRTVFPNAMGLTKALYLATWELTKKMDYARSKLGAGLRGTGHSVSRQAERSFDANLDRTPGKCYAYCTDGDGNPNLHRPPVGSPF